MTTPRPEVGRDASEVGVVLQGLAEAACPAHALPLRTRLLALRTWLSADLEELERDLATVLPREDRADPAVRAAHHLLARPGKRLRPLCVVLAARLGGRPLDGDVHGLAVAAELVHMATLLHDDVIDVGPERRGAPAAWTVTSNAASILGGDYLLLEALRRVHAVGRPELMGPLLEAIEAMVAAEALQVARRGRFEPDRAVYFEIVRGKTAALFRWCLEAGGAAGHLTPSSRRALGEAGLDLGIAFQLVDDVLDLSGDAATLGKQPLADLREGKLTWPILLACERDPELLGGLRRFAAGRGPDPEDLLGRVQRTGALEATRHLARAHAGDARTRLQALPPGPARRALETVVEAATARVA